MLEKVRYAFLKVSFVLKSSYRFLKVCKMHLENSSFNKVAIEFTNTLKIYIDSSMKEVNILATYNEQFRKTRFKKKETTLFIHFYNKKSTKII